MPRLPFRAMPDPVSDPREERRSPAGGRASTGPRSAQSAVPPADGLAEDAARGRIAMARLAEVERELALVRHHQDAKIAELEERLGWIEEHELDLRDAAERRPWLGALLGVWAGR